MENNKEKLIFALDVGSYDEAIRLVDELGGEVGAFKIGLQLFSTAGPEIVTAIVDRGFNVFLDVKFHDIPNTVAAAAVEVSRLGVSMFNIHVSGGREMMQTTVSHVHTFCKENGIESPKIIGVTVLTSSDNETLKEIGIRDSATDLTVRYALLAEECGLDGVVASPLDVERIRAAVTKSDFLIVTPGIRPAFATKDDQKRVTTPRLAIENGADYLVVGRPIRTSPDRRAAAGKIVAEMNSKAA